MNKSAEPTHRVGGFDAPVVKLEDDHLTRWPLAREVYSAAVNGPPEWSVRIGVYGEWGTGKTSVLEFVAALAEDNGNVVVRFNPWEHDSKPSLWRAFVLKVFEDAERKVGGITAGGAARKKSALAGMAKLVKPAVAIASSGAAEAADAGLGLLKGYLSFGATDLAKLKTVLGSRRLLVLIDDLDRTAPELVPEILYALKEVMDIPGFSFVCAFDPAVVGKVLRARHRGFGDGLKFLEKIIDYPVWLPPPTTEGLLKMAMADRKDHCPFVPESEIRNSFPLLPQNPRAIRQFIRLLSLLKKQITRHYETELRWSVILAATVIRTRYPKLAPALLTDLGFLRMIGMRNTMERRTAEGQKVDKEIEEHISKSAAAIGFSIDATDRRELHECMRRICDEMDLWLGTDVEAITYLASIVERPCAVTLKEFDEFLVHWESDPTAGCLTNWISTHTKAQHRADTEVARELTERAVDRYLSKLRQADAAFHPKAGFPHRAAAKLQVRLLEVLLLELHTTSDSLNSQEWIPLKLIIEKLSALGDAVSPVHQQLWKRTRALLLNVVKKWGSDIAPLMRVIKPLDSFRSLRLDGKAQRKALQEAGNILVRRLAASVTDRFAEASFVDRVRRGDGESRDLGTLLFDADGALWNGERKSILRVLRNAKRERAVQENAYEFLEWIEYILRERRNSEEVQVITRFVKDPVVFPAIWTAATAVPFAGRYVYGIRNIPEQLKALGVEIELPSRWATSLAEITFPREES